MRAVIVDKSFACGAPRRSAHAWMDRATGARVAEELIGGGYGGEANQRGRRG